MYWTKNYNGRRLIFNVADNIKLNFIFMLVHVCNSEHLFKEPKKRGKFMQVDSANKLTTQDIVQRIITNR